MKLLRTIMFMILALALTGVRVTGIPRISMVDDDFEFMEEKGKGYDDYFTEILDSLGYDYDIWEIADKGDPPLDTLLLYVDDAVIWNTGGDTGAGYPDSISTITAYNESTLAGYIDAGGSLWLSSEDYISDVLKNEKGTDADTLTYFMTDYLYVDSVHVDIGSDTMYSACQHQDNALVYDDFPHLENRIDGIFPNTDYAWIRYLNDPPEYPDDRRTTGYHYYTLDPCVFFMSFPFEAIYDQGYPKDRKTLMRHILTKLGVPPDLSIAITPVETKIFPGDTLHYSVAISNNMRAPYNDVSLFQWIDWYLFDTRPVQVPALGVLELDLTFPTTPRFPRGEHTLRAVLGYGWIGPVKPDFLDDQSVTFEVIEFRKEVPIP